MLLGLYEEALLIGFPGLGIITFAIFQHLGTYFNIYDALIRFVNFTTAFILQLHLLMSFF